MTATCSTWPLYGGSPESDPSIPSSLEDLGKRGAAYSKSINIAEKKTGSKVNILILRISRIKEQWAERSRHIPRFFPARDWRSGTHARMHTRTHVHKHTE